MSESSRFRFLMRDLAHEVDAGRLTDIEAAGRVAGDIQKTLQCLHVTFWGVSGEPGQRTMRSIAAYDGTRRMAVAGAAVFPEKDGSFFDTLASVGCYVCHDTFAEPELQVVRDTMLVPFDIRSLLAVSYGSRDELWGFITCTHNAIREWRAKEIAALRKCAAEVSSLRAQRRSLGKALQPGSFVG